MVGRLGWILGSVGFKVSSYLVSMVKVQPKCLARILYAPATACLNKSAAVTTLYSFTKIWYSNETKQDIGLMGFLPDLV